MRIFAFQDVLYGLDIIVQMHTAEYSAEGDEKGMLHLIDDLPTLYLNYFTGVVPWRKSFIWDLFSAIPWNRIGCALNQPPVEGARLPPAVVFLALDLCRMFKMYRLQVVMPIYNEAAGIWGFWKLLFQLFITCHYVGCAWFRVAADGGFVSEYDPEDNWLSNQGLLPRSENNWSYEYVTSIYWVITTMSTVGYGDILPVTRFERVFTIAIMIGGVAFFAAITGTITDIISSNRRSAVRFQDFIGEVEEFIRVAQVPSEQKSLMLQFFELKYPDRNIFNDDQIISQLPQGLRRQLLKETFGHLINQVPLFCALSENTLLQLCGEVEIINCIPKERITTEGREPDCFYVVRHGHVQLFKQSQMLQKIGPGHAFGEIGLLGISPDGLRWRSSQSLTQVELMRLRKERFISVLLQNQDLKRRYRSLAARQIERLHLSAEQGKQRIMWDRALNLSISNWQLDYVTDMEEAEYSNDMVWDHKEMASSGPANGAPLPDCEHVVIVHVGRIAGLPAFGPEGSKIKFEIRGSWNRGGKVAPSGEDCTSVSLAPTKSAEFVAVNATICVPVHQSPPEQDQEDKKKKQGKGDYVLLKFVYISTVDPVASDPMKISEQDAGCAMWTCAHAYSACICVCLRAAIGGEDAVCLYQRMFVDGAEENPTISSFVRPVREEVVAKVKVPIKKGFLDKCNRCEIPLCRFCLLTGQQL